jgi:hypothetical protein
MEEKPHKAPSMRELMPGTAALVDELRASLGQAIVDRIVRDAMRGKPTMYAAEVGPDGVLREFGHAPSGRRAVMQDGELLLPWEQGA